MSKKPFLFPSPPQVASNGGVSLVTKVTWFTRGLGSFGTSQFSTAPFLLRTRVESRMFGPTEPPVSRNLLKRGSRNIALMSFNHHRVFTWTFLIIGYNWRGLGDWESTCLTSPIFTNCFFNPFFVRWNFCINAIQFTLKENRVIYGLKLSSLSLLGAVHKWRHHF